MNDIDLHSEISGAKLGDQRRSERAASIVEAIARRPSAGFPRVFDTEAELEAFYRLVNNTAVTPDALLAPHASESWRRAEARGDSVLVLHDTSEFVYKGETPRDGLTQKATGQSFHGHFALAVAEVEAPVVHGVVAHRSYVIEEGLWLEPIDAGTFNELLIGSQRWADLVDDVSDSAPEGVGVIHVMDREADDYALWTRIVEQGDDFVIRAKQDRRLADHSSKLFDAVAQEPLLVSREVQLSRRSKRRLPGSKRTHPPRETRPAKLSIRTGSVQIKRPPGAEPLGTASMPLHIVEVVEVNPPDDAQPIHWLLLTTLPVQDAQQALRVVDIYRKRWLIEEFFKSLKTGCSAEKRQARSLSSLLNTITLLVPIAWRLLLVRAMSRHDPKAPADRIVDAVELLALRQLAKGVKLPKRPTCRQVLLAIARVGGHLKSNGEPGWLVLGRGMESLLEFTAGWRAAMKHMDATGESEM